MGDCEANVLGRVRTDTYRPSIATVFITFSVVDSFHLRWTSATAINIGTVK
jgi:hypothetical protein